MFKLKKSSSKWKVKVTANAKRQDLTVKCQGHSQCQMSGSLEEEIQRLVF